MFLVGAYTDIRWLLDSPKYGSYVEKWQPLPAGMTTLSATRASLSMLDFAEARRVLHQLSFPLARAELKVSPQLVELQLNSQSRPGLSHAPVEAITVSVRLMQAGEKGTPTAAKQSRSAYNTLANALTANGSAWGYANGYASINSDTPGYLWIENVSPDVAFDVASYVAEVYKEALLIQQKLKRRAFNDESSYVTQSGTPSWKGGSRPLYDAGLSGAGQVIGVGDSGLDHLNCFFNDAANPVTFTPTYFEAFDKTIPIYESTAHRKIRQ